MIVVLFTKLVVTIFAMSIAYEEYSTIDKRFSLTTKMWKMCYHFWHIDSSNMLLS